MNPDSTISISLSQQVTAAISIVLPVIAAVIIRPAWTDATKALVWLVLSIVAGGIGVWFDGRFNVANIAGTIGMVFVIGAVTYARLWRPTGIAPAVEENINHGPPPSEGLIRLGKEQP